MKSLKELLIDELKDLYSAENQIVKALPRIIKGVQSDDLKSTIQEHLDITKEQVSRLEQVFAMVGEKPSAKHCKGMEGLLTEGSDTLQEEEGGVLRDLQLIGAAQRVEHYEVAAYGTAKAMANKLGLSDAVDLLDQTLEEEAEADEKLSSVAESLYEEVETVAPGEGEKVATSSTSVGKRKKGRSGA